MASYWQAVGENLWLALDTLRTHKFRSLLTVLGVLIGTTTVILVASIIAGLDHAVGAGGRAIWDQGGLGLQASDGGSAQTDARGTAAQTLSYEDAMAIKEQCPAVDEVSVAIFSELSEFGLPPSTARYKGQNGGGAVMVSSQLPYHCQTRPLPTGVSSPQRTTCIAGTSP